MLVITLGEGFQEGFREGFANPSVRHVNSRNARSVAARGRMVDYLIEHDRRDLLAPAVSRG